MLPFENLGVSDDEYFADGITEELTSRLAQISGLGVVWRTSAIRYKGVDKSLQGIAEIHERLEFTERILIGGQVEERFRAGRLHLSGR